MADHKNQHFTPRRLLKPFTLDEDGKAINLFVINRGKLVQGAPVKNQCARNYLYGEDGKIEEALSQVEGRYGQIQQKLAERTEANSDLDELRFFAHLQLRRTEMASLRLAALEQDMFREIFGKDEPEKQPLRHYMLTSLKACVDTHTKLVDLRVRVIENRSNTDFVIADDPAVLVNRFMKQKRRVHSFGIQASGLMLVMPFTPRLAMICYDGLVYTAPNLVKGRIVMKKDTDAVALNQLQFLSAHSSIYFSDWDSRKDIVQQYDSVKANRVENPVTFTWLKLDGLDADGNKRYKPVSKAEAQQPGVEAVTYQEVVYPVPNAWISQLTYRNPIKIYDHGNAAGPVRNEDWLYER